MYLNTYSEIKAYQSEKTRLINPARKPGSNFPKTALLRVSDVLIFSGSKLRSAGKISQ